MNPLAASRRVLVTGGLGFIGSHLTDRLLAEGDEVVVLDNLLTGRHENLAAHADDPALRVVVGDAADPTVVEPLVDEVDLVIHLAAALGVQLVVDRPLLCLETNLLATHTVLRAAAPRSVPTMVASTSEVYGKRTDPPFAEDDDVVLGPTCHNRWGYAAAKMVDELLAFAFAREAQLPVVAFRLFNTVGPRQTGRYGMVVPRFVEAALHGEPLTVYGDGEQSRCFLHVLDAVEAIDLLSRHPAAIGTVVNIGADEPITINGLARRVLERVEQAGLLPSNGGPRTTYLPYESVFGAGFEDMRLRQPDTSRLRLLTEWSPQRDLDRILDDVIAEHRAAMVPR